MTKPLNISAAVITNCADEVALLHMVHSVLPSCSEVVIGANAKFEYVREMFKDIDKVKVYEQEWHKDFSRARNEVLAKCSGDWILVIDSDEMLNSHIEYLDESYSVYLCRIRQAINEAEIDTQEHYEVRIFKNDIGAEYKGKIHEQVSFPEMMKAAKCDVEILQGGITDEERKEKMKRNAEILLDDSDNPNKDLLLCQTFNMTTEINTYLKHAFNVMHGDYDNSAKALVCYWTALTMAANNYGKDVVRQWLGASIMYEPMQICSRHILFKMLQEATAPETILSNLYNKLKEINEARSSGLPLDYYLNQSFFEPKQ